MVLGSTRAHARDAASDAPPPTKIDLTPYEREAIDTARSKLGAKLVESPEGKIIESIVIARYDVIDERDMPARVWVDIADSPDVPLPDALNAIHIVSKDYVVRREMLLHEGDAYRAVLVQETARNLRALSQLSGVNIVAVSGSDQDHVRLLVVTKDLWSLRLSYDITATPGGVESFVFVPQETNLGGHHVGLNLRYVYQPLSNTFGAGLNIPRFGLSRVGASVAGSFATNALTGAVEGQSISLAISRPLYSTRTEWSWSSAGNFTNGVSRRYVNAKLGGYDAAATKARDDIPYEYKSQSRGLSAGATRSWGWRTKWNLSGSLAYSNRSFTTIDDLSKFDPRAVNEFKQRIVPVGERRIGPKVTLSTYQNEFLALTDVQTYALQEDVSLYQSLSASVYPVLEALGSTRNVVGGSLSAQYTVPLRAGKQAGYLSTAASTFAEVDTARGKVSDGAVTTSMRLVSPKTSLGRLVLVGSYVSRYANYLNDMNGVGGDTRLRGYPSNFFTGKDLVLGNVELRSRSFRLLSLQVGGVAFFDIGDTPNGLANTVIKEDVGVGARVLIPWLNRVVFRADLGFPLNRTQAACGTNGTGCKIDPVSFFVSFDQAI